MSRDRFVWNDLFGECQKAVSCSFSVWCRVQRGRICASWANFGQTPVLPAEHGWALWSHLPSVLAPGISSSLLTHQTLTGVILHRGHWFGCARPWEPVLPINSQSLTWAWWSSWERQRQSCANSSALSEQGSCERTCGRTQNAREGLKMSL